MKNTLVLVISMICSFAIAQNNYFEIYNDSTKLKNQNDALIREMEKQIQTTNPYFNFKGLTTEIPNTFMPGQYRSKTNKIYLNTWQVGGPPMEAFLADVAGSNEKGNTMAALYFYGFFLPHEVGHALQHHTQKEPENNYDGEYEANELAITYWRSKGKQKELQQCYEMAKIVLAKLKNPIPKNEDVKTYVTAHYYEMLKDPYQYAYIQFSQIVTIFEDKSLPTFDVYIQKYFPKK